MPITVYWGSGSPYSWRVLLNLAAKGLDWEDELISFSARDHKSPDFLKLNPRGKVPVIVDGDLTLYESAAICAYLDAAYPDPPLRGATPEETAEVHLQLAQIDAYLAERALTTARIFYFRDPADQNAEVAKDLESIHTELFRIDLLLSDRDYLAGSSISDADCWLYPILLSLERAASKPAAAAFDMDFIHSGSRYPALAAWAKRIESIPGFDRTYPPHWRT